MRAAIIGASPTGWLKALGKSPSETSEILATYDKAATLQVVSYRAEHLFLRFHGAKSKTPIFQPNYWADGTALGSAFGRATQFAGLLSDQEISKIAKNYYREITAICHNWNALNDTALWKIELKESETIEGLEGPVAQQPTFAADKFGPATSSMLLGGALQVYLNPKTPFICTPVNWDAI